MRRELGRRPSLLRWRNGRNTTNDARRAGVRKGGSRRRRIVARCGGPAGRDRRMRRRDRRRYRPASVGPALPFATALPAAACTFSRRTESRRRRVGLDTGRPKYAGNRTLPADDRTIGFRHCGPYRLPDRLGVRQQRQGRRHCRSRPGAQSDDAEPLDFATGQFGYAGRIPLHGRRNGRDPIYPAKRALERVEFR